MPEGAGDGLPSVLMTREGDFRITALVAQSATGVLCRGRALSGERSIAIKFHADPATAAREAAMLRRLDGAHAPRLIDDLQIDGRTALVMDWVDGVSLEHWPGTLGDDTDGNAARAVLIALARAIGAMHDAGVLHRDLKPAHAFLQPDGTVSLIDFSAAMTLEPGALAVAPGAMATDLTPGVAAPEQVDSALGPEGTWTDVHGFGVILFWLANGRLPGEGDRAPAEGDDTMLALARDCLTRAPRDRPADAAALIARLEQTGALVVSDGPREAFPETLKVRERQPGVVPDPPAAPPPPRRGLGVVTVLLILLLLGAAGFAGYRYGMPLYDRHVRIDWTVDPAGGGDALSIAEVLTRGGETLAIMLAPGRYTVPPVVERRLSIVPMPGGSAVPVITAGAGGGCLLLERSDVAISGVDLDGTSAASADAAPCIHARAGRLSLATIAVTGTTGPGLVAEQGAVLEVSDLSITEGTSGGIALSGGVEALLSSVTIGAMGGDGIRVAGGARVEASDLSVISSGGTGLRVAGGAQMRLDDARILKAGASGIEVTDGARLALDGVEITEASGAGIAAYDGARLTLANSAISGSVLSGLFVEAAAEVTLEGVGIIGNGEHGVLMLSARRGQLSGVDIRKNKGAGVALFPDAVVALGELTVQENAGGDLLDGRTTKPESETEAADAGTTPDETAATEGTE